MIKNNILAFMFWIRILNLTFILQIKEFNFSNY